MQPKVSIVIPCYNKAKYIGNMFDSIISQKWDNIELILVNDGSTDGTRAKIAEWVHKFYECGFEVVIIDQENRGLPAAVYEGLKRVTGEFVCQVDADDELDPEYVSTMAGCLADNPGYDWTVCDMVYVYPDGKEVHKSYFNSRLPEELVMSDIGSSFLLSKIVDTVPGYMVRTSYMAKSGMTKNYYFDCRRTQEPQWVIPLAVSGGELKYIKKPLYRYIQNSSMMSARKTYEDVILYVEQYFVIVKETIKNLNAGLEVKKRLLSIASLARLYRIAMAGKIMDLKSETLSLINTVFTPGFNSSFDTLEEITLLLSSAVDNILGVKHVIADPPAGRIIAWGVLGKNGGRYIPFIQKTKLCPDELWDINGDGNAIKTPDISFLTEHDLVLVFPSKQDMAQEIEDGLKKSGVPLMHFEDVYAFVCFNEFPEFYNGLTRFDPINFMI